MQTEVLQCSFEVYQYIDKFSKKRFSKWEDQFEQELIKHLSHNEIFKLAVIGVLLEKNRDINSAIPPGEEVYITHTSATKYGVQTVDGMKFNVNKKYIGLKTTGNPTKTLEKWENTLKTIEKVKNALTQFFKLFLKTSSRFFSKTLFQ